MATVLSEQERQALRSAAGHNVVPFREPVIGAPPGPSDLVGRRARKSRHRSTIRYLLRLVTIISR